MFYRYLDFEGSFNQTEVNQKYYRDTLFTPPFISEDGLKNK